MRLNLDGSNVWLLCGTRDLRVWREVICQQVKNRPKNTRSR